MSYFTALDIVPRLNDTVRLQADEFLASGNATEAIREYKRKMVFDGVSC